MSIQKSKWVKRGATLNNQRELPIITGAEGLGFSRWRLTI